MTFAQVSPDGNITTSTLQLTPTRQDNGKTLMCRATNELVKRGLKEATMKLNVCCKSSVYIVHYILVHIIYICARVRLNKS